MKPGTRRWWFWLLLAVYAAGSIWWTFSVPHAPEQLLRAIPGHATLVSWHDQLAPRWTNIYDHPVVLSAVAAMQGDTNEWEVLQSDPGFKTTLQLIGKNELVLAHVPYMGIYNEDAWVFAGWIGGQSQRLRWSERFLNIPGLRRMEDVGGWPVWSWHMSSESGSFRITLALVEGMIVGTTARDPMAIEVVIDSYNGLFPSVAFRRDLIDWNELLMTSVFPDRFWFKSDAVPGIDRAFTELEIKDASRMSASVRFFPPSELPVLPESLMMEELAALWGDDALAASSFGTDVVINALRENEPTVATAMINEIIATSRADAVALGVFGGEVSGRFKGIKVPTVMAALQRTEGGDTAEWLGQVVDRWNARSQWGLVSVPVLVGTTTLWRIEGTSGGLYGSMGTNEQVALMEAGDWLVISSNLKGLVFLASRAQGVTVAQRPLWAERLEDAVSDGAGGYLGVDLVRGYETLRLAITAYSLKLLFEDASGSRALRQQLNETKAWLETLARLEHLDLYVSPADPYIKVDIQTGR